MNARIIALLVFSGLFLASCQEYFLTVVHVSKKDVTISFSEEYVIYNKSFEPCISSLELYDISNSPVKVWHITSGPSACTRIKSIVIGTVPAGFRQEGSFSSLSQEAKYRVEAYDDGHRLGAGEFVLP